ncbi:hypothetical protein [Neptuniibacter sp.]|uniref:hypothetical protein n=1 Tax=Neptuniibacter sp. TaxID=1962643 RepID=UPI003B593992
MDIKIINNRFSLLGNRTIPLLTIDGELDLYSAGYLIRMLNEGSLPPTIRNHAKGIRALYLFCEKQGINLPERMRQLDNLRLPEIESLRDWMSVRTDTGELQSEGTYKLRFKAAKAFIFYYWDTYQSRASNNPERLNHARLKHKVMENAFKTAEEAPYTRSAKNYQGLTPELKIKFLEIIIPFKENELNPFKSEHVRWRNYVLLLTMILGGNRRSESVLMQLQDITLHGRDKYFEIVKSNNPLPKNSPHAQAPGIKTKGRKIGLSDDMASIFEFYIRRMRTKFKGSAKSTDLFLSTRNGLPLAVHTPNAVIDTINEAYPEFKGHLTPHRLRNTFHDMLSDALDEKLDEEMGNESPMMKESQKQVIQEHAGGWNRGSSMTAHYPAGAIERRVIGITRKAQKAALNPRKDKEETE